MPTLKEMNRHMWGCGRSLHPHICLFLFLQGPFSAACWTEPNKSHSRSPRSGLSERVIALIRRRTVRPAYPL